MLDMIFDLIDKGMDAGLDLIDTATGGTSKKSNNWYLTAHGCPLFEEVIRRTRK